MGGKVFSERPLCVVVSSSKVLGNGCMRPRRFCDCRACDVAPRCKQDPSHVERLRLSALKLKQAKEDVAAARTRYLECVRESQNKQGD